MLGKGPPRKGVSGPAARGGKDLDWQWEQRGQGPPGLVAVTGASGIIKSSKGNIFSLPAPAPAKNFAGACQSICLRRQRYQGYDTPRNRQHVPWSASANPPKHYIMQIVCPVRLGDSPSPTGRPPRILQNTPRECSCSTNGLAATI